MSLLTGVGDGNGVAGAVEVDVKPVRSLPLIHSSDYAMLIGPARVHNNILSAKKTIINKRITDEMPTNKFLIAFFRYTLPIPV